MENKNIDKRDLELELLKQANAERKVSDERYAPMIVKTILYALLGVLASGVVFGMGDLIIKAFINNVDESAHTQPASVIESIYDLPQ